MDASINLQGILGLLASVFKHLQPIYYSFVFSSMILQACEALCNFILVVSITIKILRLGSGSPLGVARSLPHKNQVFKNDFRPLKVTSGRFWGIFSQEYTSNCVLICCFLFHHDITPCAQTSPIKKWWTSLTLIRLNGSKSLQLGYKIRLKVWN